MILSVTSIYDLLLILLSEYTVTSTDADMSDSYKRNKVLLFVSALSTSPSLLTAVVIQFA